MGQIYLLHFDQPYKHAKHYLGYVDGDTKEDLDHRINQHRNGTGARLMQVLKEHGIGFSVARVWKNKSRKDERDLKNTKCVPKYCPICKQLKV